MSSVFLEQGKSNIAEFSSSGLQSRRGGSSAVSAKGSYFFPVALAHPAHLVWGFTLREAECTKLHLNTSVAKLAFVSEGS